MVVGRTLSFDGPPPTLGRPATVISARDGGYGPSAPKHGMDHLVPALETVLGHPADLGLDLTTVRPEPTTAPRCR
jgi:FMN-dependent NADH-azoreductase